MITLRLLALRRLDSGRIRLHRPALAFLLIILFALPARAQVTILHPSPAIEGTTYGNAVAVLPDRIAVGDARDDESGEDAGAVYVYDRVGSDWVLDAKLLPSDPEPNERRFGTAVALDGDRLAAISLDPDSRQRWVSIYVRTESGWTRQARVIHSFSGRAMALEGDELLVGLPYYHDGNEGAVLPVLFENGEWGIGGPETLLQPDDAAPEDYFGIALDLDGPNALIGALGIESTEGAGAAYLFERDGAGWSEAQRLAPDGLDPEALFGSALSLHGTTALIGAYGEDGVGTNSGAAYVYTFDGAAWAERARLTGSDAGEGALFGFSVATNGTYAIVGAPGARGGRGAAYVFEHDGTTWTERAATSSQDGSTDRNYGLAVGLTDALLVVGAPPNAGAALGGEVYVYDLLAVDTEPAAAIERSSFYVAPNPFRSATTAHFALAEPARVRAAVYDVLGREVLRLPETAYATGEHALSLDLQSLPAGLYVLRLETADAVQSLRLTHLR